MQNQIESQVSIPEVDTKITDLAKTAELFTKSDHLSAEGARQVSTLYEEKLRENGNDVVKTLDWCKEQEQLLNKETQGHELKIIRSIRGKTIYNAHLVWATEAYGIDNFGDKAASNIMKYSRLLREGKDINVYEQATLLLQKAEKIEQHLGAVSQEHEAELTRVVNGDVQKAIEDPSARPVAEKLLKQKLDELATKFLSGKRLKVFTSAAVCLGLLSASAPVVESNPINQDRGNPRSEPTSEISPEIVVPAPRPSLPKEVISIDTVAENPDDKVVESDEDIPVYAPKVVKKTVALDTQIERKRSDRLSIDTKKYIAETQEAATKVALEIDFVNGSVESPSNMCGPLAFTILKEAGVLPQDFEAVPHDFWLAPPERLETIFTKEQFDQIKVREPVSIYDFSKKPLKPGDFMFLRGGSFGHMIAVTEVDEEGRAWAISNVRYPDETYKIQEVMLYDPNDPEAGFFRDEWKWPNSPHGWTGSQGFDLYRIKK